ncbi:aminotransferase class I/II-fold pyridoxal phosphate-dependent enzyme [Jannaschia seohaensis]|uniref:Aspartate/methionine/tyrosine aminotransferase n=1 Tax=Jannaschia seohaensis TaxID=475081 RepID=A0A2Y9A8M6_9RHOB|nr:aminotransferase class I/II-fold pyridoxal phosphate-dependent enzyme [Jannaschia seohaensis]PWJ22269.1 aspartate/methionine/tyrosine aminotransferase [Jannaschia seohaensis]SSA38547.1 Aspartate/methionine/tyrosine aminotransferase [Jannaschia seohaensis]
MKSPKRFSELPEYAFPRLRRLLGDRAPGSNAPVEMTIGDPRHDPPAFVAEVIAEHAEGFRGYPPNDGAPELLTACADWLHRRYGYAADPATDILVLNGTREGLYNTTMALCPEQKNGQTPAILTPNPFYQVYAVAALSVGAEPVYVNATAATGHLPDFGALDPGLLDRTAEVYICSPANPQGAVASMGYWSDLLALAEKHDFKILADECYAEIYRDTPPTGILEAVRATGADPERVVAFHSLSKRSNLAGLRSGFAVSGPGNIALMKQLRNYSGAPLPLPLQMAAAAVWADEAHVEENRALYRAKFDAAERILGDLPGVEIPEAGFFLWLPVPGGDGEAAALRLWEEAGVKVLPGAYLARDTADGNPGTPFVRAALVAPLDQVEAGLTRLRAHLTP